MTTAMLDEVAAIETAASVRRRVLHVVNGEFFAGAERVQDLLAGALPEFGFDVVFAAVKPGAFDERRRNRTAPLYETPMRHKFDLRPVRQLAEIVRRERCHLIHTHTVRAALVGRIASRLTGVPMVHHLHSPTLRDTTHFWRNVGNTLVERFCTRKADGVIAVSESLGRYGVEHGLRSERIHVVHNGVPVAASYVERPTPHGVWTLGCTALFRPRKGLETLLEALSQLSRKRTPVRLRAVGPFETPEYEREIHALVARLGIGDLIEWRGFRSDVAAEFAAMDLFVLPSLFGEGLPMVVLEAMSFGVPVVSTRVEGIPEAIRDGIDGRIVEPGDAAALAEAVTQIVRGDVDWQAVRRSARRRQTEQFSDRSMAAGTAAAYGRVLGDVVSCAAETCVIPAVVEA